MLKVVKNRNNFTLRILYLHQYYFKPEEGGPIRSSYLAQAMAAAGHEVLMLSTHNGSGVKEEAEANYRVIRLPIAYHNTFSTYQRLRAWWAYQSHCRAIVPSLGPFDLVYASSTPLSVGILALLLQKDLSLPYIFEVRDAWPEVPLRAGYLKFPGLGHLLKHLAARIYRNALGVVALAPPVQEWLQKKYQVSNVHYCPNLSDVDYYPRADLPETAPLQLVYAGSLGRSSGFPELLEWADYIQHHQLPITIHVAGEGHYKEQVAALAQQNTHLQYHGHLQRAELRNLFHRCHYGLVWFERKNGYDWNSPNKFFDYLAAGLPVICTTEAWYSTMASAQGAGILAKEGSLEKLSHELLQEGPRYLERSGAATNLARSHFHKEHHSASLVAFLEECFRVYTSKP